MKEEKTLIQLSKTISHALRHEPWVYELELDDEGWVAVDDLLLSLRNEKTYCHGLSESDVNEIIATSAKQRFELKNGKIRALYGHSTPQKLLKEPADPPTILYHGTSPKAISKIINDGIKPMRRQYVHLSVDVETAKQVALRKSSHPNILTIRAKEAFLNAIPFYKGNEHVWLADFIPSKYIEFIK